jgi:hypothetical protein
MIVFRRSEDCFFNLHLAELAACMRIDDLDELDEDATIYICVLSVLSERHARLLPKIDCFRHQPVAQCLGLYHRQCLRHSYCLL